MRPLMVRLKQPTPEARSDAETIALLFRAEKGEERSIVPPLIHSAPHSAGENRAVWNCPRAVAPWPWEVQTLSSNVYLGETGPLSQGVQACRKALRIRYIHGMEVRRKWPRGFKKEAQGVQASPLNRLSVSP